MRKISFLLLLVISTIMFKVLAERINIPGLDLPKLIITEVRSDAESTAYIELTNKGNTAIDLEPFTLFSVFYNTRCQAYSDSAITFSRSNAELDKQIGKVYLKGIIQPGESFVISSVWDADNARKNGIPTHNTALAQIGKQFVHKPETNNLNGWINKPEWQCFGMDSVSAPGSLLRAEASAGYLIQWKYTDPVTGIPDSTFIDQFNHFWYPDENVASGINITSKGYWEFPIAGVVDAHKTSVLVRKYDIDKGNLNWNQSRGTDALTSEWLVVPKNTSKDMAFKTAGVHGIYNLNYTSKNPSVVTINEGAKTISIPWQIVRGDSLARYFNLGDGMSWKYTQNPVFADSASYIARNGDKFAFYAVGNEVKSAEFTLQVREPEANLAMVFPKRRLTSEAVITPNEITGIPDTTYVNSWSGFVYGLSSGGGVDSIINVGYATRSDSLLTYLDKPANAKWEFVFHDGQNRVDLQFGDKLKVTSADNSTTKEYFIAVSDYVQSNNALLRTVTWPDINFDEYPRWIKGDTLEAFTPLKTEYIVELAYNAKTVPAFQFIPQDSRAKMSVKNAVSLTGNRDQRTTSVTVTSESDTISTTYNFIFQKQGIPVQPNIAEPFFSEFIQGVNTQGYAIEIYNPGTEELDLSRYCVVRGTSSQSWQEAVETCITGNTVATFTYTADGSKKPYQTHYFPSKRWRNDGTPEEWNATPTPENPYAGKGWLIDDNQTDPWVKGGDVFVLGTGIKSKGTYASQDKIVQESDFIFRGHAGSSSNEAWPGYVIYHQATPVWTRNYLYLLKVTNDSILDGTKNVRDASAYELIDLFVLQGDSVAGIKNAGQMNLKRKSSVSKGTLVRAGGMYDTPESSEWIVTTTGSGLYSNIGVHVMDPRTDYKSTVTSLKLIVSPEYMGDDLTIKGAITSYTPSTISLVLDKADESQVFTFKRGTTVLTADETLADGDVLLVTAGNGIAKTSYTLVNVPLDNNTSLMAKAGSGLTVTADNRVTGVVTGTTLKDALSKLEVAEKSLLYVYDAKGVLQSLKVHNADSLVMDVLVSEDLVLEVVAENNDKATYNFDFNLASNVAILQSTTLQIDQDRKLILTIPGRLTVPVLLNMVFANKGATIKVLDKAGFQRVIGYVNIDDVIEVTAPDGVTKVEYKLDESMYSSVRNIYDNAVSFEIFPNPASNVINVRGIEAESVKVFTLTGVMTISEDNVYGNKVDVSDLTNGVYIIQIVDSKGKVVTDKFLKK